MDRCSQKLGCMAANKETNGIWCCSVKVAFGQEHSLGGSAAAPDQLQSDFQFARKALASLCELASLGRDMASHPAN